MEQVGTDFNASGSVMTRSELEEARKKRGECVTCGQKCFQKKLLRMLPITINGRVLNGRCLHCHPLEIGAHGVLDDEHGEPVILPAESRMATADELERFRNSQANLMLASSATAQSTRNLNPNSSRSLRSTGSSSGSSPMTPTTTTTTNNNRSSSRRSLQDGPAAGSRRNVSSSDRSSNPTGSNRAATTMRRTTRSPARSSGVPNLQSHVNSGGGYSHLVGRSSESLVSNESASAAERQPRHSLTRPLSSGRLRNDEYYADGNESYYSADNSARPSRHYQMQSSSGGYSSGGGGRREASSRSFVSMNSMDEQQNNALSSSHHRRQHGEDHMRSDSFHRRSRGGGDPSYYDDDQFYDESAVAPPLDHHDHRRDRDYCNLNDYNDDTGGRPGTAHEDLQAALERIMGHALDGGGGGSGSDVLSMNTQSHPAAAALVDYYRRSMAQGNNDGGGVPTEFSNRSLRSSNSNHTSGDDSLPRYELPARHGTLNRGGAISTSHFPQHRQRSPPSASSPSQPYAQQSHFAVTQQQQQPEIISTGSLGSRSGSRRRLRGGSSRSLDSVSSFGDDHHDVSMDHLEQMNEHLARLAQAMEMKGPSTSDVRRGHVYASSSRHPSSQPPHDLRHGGAPAPAASSASPYTEMRLPSRSRQSGDPDGAAVEQLLMAGNDYVEVINLMHDYEDSAVFLTRAMQHLSNLELTADDHETLANVGAIHVMLSALRAFPEDLELQTYGCRAMWNTSGTAINQIAYCESGALEVLLQNMDQFLDQAELQLHAMATLANMGAVEANLDTMIDKRVVPRIVDSMNKHSENAQVQMKGCAALTNMASHASPLKKSIMEMGGGGAIVIAMVMHPNDPMLQEKGLRALRNLSANSDENKIEMANIGGIDAIVSAMQIHRDVGGVQEAGAWTLSNLASNADIRALIGDCGGIDVTIRAMWVHSDEESLQEWCCRALYTLSLDTQNSKMILDVGGISAVVNAMQAHVNSSVVQEMGCAVLCNLATDEARKMRVVDEEALDAIVLAMVLYSDDVKVQERACQVLVQLAISANFKSMHASNIGELARTAANKFPQQCGESANALLSTLDQFAAEYTSAPATTTAAM